MEKALTPRSAAKRQAVLDAAQECFLERGYAGSSIDEVTARAGVSKATVYAHFPGKDKLFGAIICQRCDDQAEGLTSLTISPGADARSVLTTVAKRLLTLFLSPEVMGIYRIVIAEAPRYPELAQTWYEAGPLRGKQRLQAIFNQLKAQGLLDFNDEYRAVDMFVGCLRGECFHRVLLDLPPNPRFPPEAVIESAVDLILTAFSPKT